MRNNNIWTNFPSQVLDGQVADSNVAEVKSEVIPTKIIKTQNIIISDEKNDERGSHLFTISKNSEDKSIESFPPNGFVKIINLLQKKIPRRKGRIKKLGQPEGKQHYLFQDTIHSKYNQDNIKRKIKTHFHNFIIAYLNKEIRKEWGGIQKFKFRKLESSITQDITISYNKKMLEKPLKVILSKVSKKFKDRDTNANFIDKISKYKPNIRNLLNKTYEEMYLDYYLKSTHKTFSESNDKDESFEEHLQKIADKDGQVYYNKYKENAINFVHFFKNCKERKRRSRKESGTSNDSEEEKENSQSEQSNKDKANQTTEEKQNVNNILYNNQININNFTLSGMNNEQLYKNIVTNIFNQNNVIGTMNNKDPSCYNFFYYNYFYPQIDESMKAASK